MRRFLAVGVCLAIAACAAPAAQSATRWSPPDVLFRGRDLFIPAPLFGLPDGRTFAGAGYSNWPHGDDSRTDLALRRPGGSFTAPVTIGAGHEGVVGIFANGVGDAVLVDVDGDGHTVVRRQAQGARFGPAEELVDAPALTATLSDDGAISVVVRTREGRLVLVTRTPAGTITQREVPDSEETYVAGLAVLPGGATVVVWRHSPDDDVQSAVALPGLPFGPRETIAKASYSSLDNLDVVQDASGNALAAWTGGDRRGMFEYGSVHTSYRPLGGDWGPPRTIPGDPVSNALRFDLAMNRRGDAAITWEGDGSVSMSYRPAGGDWERATDAPENVDRVAQALDPATDPAVAIGANGDAIVAYRGGAYERACVESMEHPGAGRFGPAEPVLGRDWPHADIPRVAVGPRGEAVLDFGGTPDADGEGRVWWAAHQITTEPADPSVTCLRTAGAGDGSGAKALVYRLNRSAKTKVRVRRVAGARRPRVGQFVTRGVAGVNRTKLPAALRRKLRPGRTYAAEVTAISRSGRSSGSRVVRFSP